MEYNVVEVVMVDHLTKLGNITKKQVLLQVGFIILNNGVNHILLLPVTIILKENMDHVEN